jgi:hypothetical protein
MTDEEGHENGDRSLLDFCRLNCVQSKNDVHVTKSVRDITWIIFRTQNRRHQILH